MKRFITVRMWEETKDKLEQVRIDKCMKEKKIVSLAQVIDELVDEYLKSKKIDGKLSIFLYFKVQFYISKCKNCTLNIDIAFNICYNIYVGGISNG